MIATYFSIDHEIPLSILAPMRRRTSADKDENNSADNYSQLCFVTHALADVFYLRIFDRCGLAGLSISNDKVIVGCLSDMTLDLGAVVKFDGHWIAHIPTPQGLYILAYFLSMLIRGRLRLLLREARVS